MVCLVVDFLQFTAICVSFISFEKFLAINSSNIAPVPFFFPELQLGIYYGSSIWLPWWLRWSRVCLKCGRPGFNPWVGKISWRRKWQPTPVFLPGESHGRRSLVGHSPWGCKGSDRTEWLHTHRAFHLVFHRYFFLYYSSDSFFKYNFSSLNLSLAGSNLYWSPSVDFQTLSTIFFSILKVLLSSFSNLFGHNFNLLVLLTVSLPPFISLNTWASFFVCF